MHGATALARLAILATFFLSFGCATPGGGPKSAPDRVEKSPDDEIRALWVDSWGPGIYTAAQCDETIAYARRAGFNTLLVEVRKVADAYYTSLYEPRGKDETTGQPIDPAFDPLEYLCDRVRDIKGMRIEAWVVANRVWKGKELPGPTQPAHLFHTWPQWILTDINGSKFEGEEGGERSVFVDPSDPMVRERLTAVATDIVKNYDVDAIHLDYIRYPGNTWGYTPTSIAHFQTDTGRTDRPEPTDTQFVEWRAAQVTESVRAVRERIKNVNPKVDLTASVVSWGKIGPGGYKATAGYLGACQDWTGWLDQGLLDIAYIMHYRREHLPDQADDFRNWFKEFEAHRKPDTRVVVGIGAYLNDLNGSIRQVKDALSQRLDGIAVFSYRVPSKNAAEREAFAEALRIGPFGIQP